MNDRELLGNFCCCRLVCSSPLCRENSNKMSPCSAVRMLGLVWPMVLTLGVSKTADFNSTTDAGSAEYAVSDGWWWCPAHLDADLQALVRRGRLKDGDKICIFTAIFPKAPGPQAVSLQMNGVRPVNPSHWARHGYISPRYLARGLTLPSLTNDGGGVYAINATIVHVSDLMCKVRRPSWRP